MGSLGEKLGSAELASASLGIEITSAPTVATKEIAAVSPAPPSVPPPAVGSPTQPSALGGEKPPAVGPSSSQPSALVDEKAANQVTNDDDDFPGWGVFLILVLVLICVSPIFCYIFARFKYGRLKLRLPFEAREKFRLELHEPVSSTGV